MSEDGPGKTETGTNRDKTEPKLRTKLENLRKM
jgi:hypothetical protein